MRVRDLLQPGSANVTATGPGADGMMLSGVGVGGTPAAPPVVTFPFQKVGDGANMAPFVVISSPCGANVGGVALPACPAPVAPEACVEQIEEEDGWPVLGTALGILGGLIFLTTCSAFVCNRRNARAARGE